MSVSSKQKALVVDPGSNLGDINIEDHPGISHTLTLQTLCKNHFTIPSAS